MPHLRATSLREQYEKMNLLRCRIRSNARIVNEEKTDELTAAVAAASSTRESGGLFHGVV